MSEHEFTKSLRENGNPVINPNIPEDLQYRLLSLPEDFKGFLVVDRAAGINVRALGQYITHLKTKGLPILFTNDIHGIELFDLKNFTEEETE